MSKVYFTSDLHFGDDRICIRFRGMTSEQNGEFIVHNWNKIITKKDTVYILGDFSTENPKVIKEYLNKLNGVKVLIGGNHDDKKCCKEFADLGITVMGCLEYKGFICTHIPIHPLEVNFFKGNIHGHLHTFGKTKLEDNRYYNVASEFHNFSPVLFSDIEEYFNNLKE